MRALLEITVVGNLNIVYFDRSLALISKTKSYEKLDPFVFRLDTLSSERKLSEIVNGPTFTMVRPESSARLHTRRELQN